MKHKYQYPTVIELPKQMAALDHDTFNDWPEEEPLAKVIPLPLKVGEVILKAAQAS